MQYKYIQHVIFASSKKEAVEIAAKNYPTAYYLRPYKYVSAGNNFYLFEIETEVPNTTIRIGDKFKRGECVLEVVGTKPGGKIELYDRQNHLQTDKWHRDVIKLERICTQP